MVDELKNSVFENEVSLDGYYIFCLERKMWWRPDNRGYTEHLTDAGLYAKEEAIDICIKANVSGIEEIPVSKEIAWRLF